MIIYQIVHYYLSLLFFTYVISYYLNHYQYYSVTVYLHLHIYYLL